MGKTEAAVPVCSCSETVCSSSKATIPVCSRPETAIPVCSSPETVCSSPTLPAVSPPQRRLSARLCQLSRSEPLHQPSRLLPRRAVLRPAAASSPASLQTTSPHLPPSTTPAATTKPRLPVPAEESGSATTPPAGLRHPNLQSASTNLQSASRDLQTASTNLQTASTDLQAASTNPAGHP